MSAMDIDMNSAELNKGAPLLVYSFMDKLNEHLVCCTECNPMEAFINNCDQKKKSQPACRAKPRAKPSCRVKSKPSCRPQPSCRSKRKVSSCKKKMPSCRAKPKKRSCKPKKRACAPKRKKRCGA